MVKVLFEGSIFLHQNIGGVSKYIIKLNDNLKGNNINSKIYCPLTINNFLKKNKNNEIFYFKFKKIPRFFRRIFFTINNILTIFYISYYKPDILHFSYYNDFLAKYLKVPYILTVYDLIHEKEKYEKNFFDKKRSIENAKHIICISKKTRKDLIRLYKVNKKKISVIYLGTDQTKTKLNKKIKKKKFILYVGSRHRYKNFNNFIKAYSKSKYLKDNYKILCFGGGDFKYKEIELFENLNIQDNISLKQGDDLDLKRLYRNASIFVTVSTSEGFGLTPFEAISSGCPVVCSNIEVFKENLKGCSYFVNPVNINDIKFGIENVLKNKIKKQKLINNGFKLIKNFTWDITASKTSEIYRKTFK